ncbi:hypothetical protein J7M23_12045, partial [Candidatus Sumerlaeota bacterium]|nr:hypothetical protein [Candidatus Sumerlaeota bacterium]
GRIFVGPLYDQPDEFLVSGESIIRNLLIGSELAREFGRRMNVGYFPDPFGHISQLPQILNGFGLDSFIFMRGMGDEVEELGTEFFWFAPDKESKVLAINQINSYGNFRSAGVPFSDPWHFKADFDKAVEKADFEVETLSRYARTPFLLLNNGIDHHPPQEEIVEIIKYINRRRHHYRLIHSNFERYVNAVKRYQKRFKSFIGEFRRGYRNWVLSGVYSSRLYIKQENEKTQTLMENTLEPLSVFLWLYGAEYPEEVLRHLWKTLLKNHPHDSICGCSVDAVHRDMMMRYEHVSQSASFLLWWYRVQLLDRIQLKPRKYGEPVVVFNTLPWSRKWVFVEQEIFLPEVVADSKSLRLVNSRGESIYAEFSAGEDIENEHLWGKGKMKKLRLRFYIPELPGMGFETFYVRGELGSRHRADKDSNRKMKAGNSTSPPPLKLRKQGMENEFYRITINNDGTLNVVDKETGLRLSRVHWFEDRADGGDTYDYSPVDGDRPITTLGKRADDIRLIESSSFRIVWRITRRWRLPAELKPDRSARSSKTVAVDIISDVTLWAGKKRIDFQTRITNRAKDHRLRCGFALPFPTKGCFAETKFDVIERPHLTRDEIQRQRKAGWFQLSQPTAPQDRFVSFSNKKWGVSFINKGLTEYEASSRGTKSFYYLTLLRCCGWVSRPDLKTRPQHAGPLIAVPEAQCQGTYEMHYALTTHNGGWEQASVGRTAMEHNIPVFVAGYENRFRGQQSPALLGERFSLFEMTPDSPVLISALKKAEHRNSLVLRVFNPASKTERLKVRSGKKFKQIYRLRLDEQREECIRTNSNNSFSIKIPPHKIYTIEIVY